MLEVCSLQSLNGAFCVWLCVLHLADLGRFYVWRFNIEVHASHLGTSDRKKVVESVKAQLRRSCCAPTQIGVGSRVGLARVADLSGTISASLNVWSKHMVKAFQHHE